MWFQLASPLGCAHGTLKFVGSLIQVKESQRMGIFPIMLTSPSNQGTNIHFDLVVGEKRTWGSYDSHLLILVNDEHGNRGQENQTGVKLL